VVEDRVLEGLPQRAPFLFIDKIIELDENQIHARKHLTGKEDFFSGHFPGMPIMPGVLLQEATFQAGALLMSQKAGSSDEEKVGVVTRVDKVKFKNFCKPGDTLDIKVQLLDSPEGAFYFKGRVLVNEKVMTSLQFAGTLVSPTQLQS
jgi:3-hydroxyacyl-[acyl-carrier-protein] dehydratase